MLFFANIQPTAPSSLSPSSQLLIDQEAVKGKLFARLPCVYVDERHPPSPTELDV